MGRSETEAAAALIVRACQVLGDRWQPVGPRDIGKVITVDIDAGVEPFKSLSTNPFWRPSYHGLVASGCARFLDDSVSAPIELTPVGIEKLRRYVTAE